ncbi:MAG TPA: winged helix DNA-binding domain-containing protein [Candidatus Saccharimonadales bacterium]|nr:winged helix DNA-binding domain-containing protein [Candidatus Saccharimonadales bacterium]
MDIANLRLSSQHIAQADFKTAHDVVAWMGAMQAQDYNGALWAIALRTPNLTKDDVEKAIAERQIVRTWPMRGTLHFLAAEDARWITQLLAPRALAAATSRRKQLAIDDAVLAAARDVIVRALEGGKCLTRNDLLSRLDDAGIATAEQRGSHLLYHWAAMTLICFGPHEGKQPTFVLMDEWLPPTPERTREEALKELATRYFKSHGPASLRDFAGWGKLTVKDARLGIELAGTALASQEENGTVYWFDPAVEPAAPATYLLPGFDEYMLGYKDRTAALALEHTNRIVPGNNGMFLPTLVNNGQVVATWKKTVRSKSQTILITSLEAPSDVQLASVAPALKRYEAYSGLPTSCELASTN